jgi:hypothetical protein
MARSETRSDGLKAAIGKRMLLCSNRARSRRAAAEADRSALGQAERKNPPDRRSPLDEANLNFLLLSVRHLVLTKSPFLSAERVRVCPDSKKASAHVIGAGGLEAWVRACLALLRPGGTLLMIGRTDALQAVLQALSPRTGAVVVLPIHPRADQPASRILVRAIKGRRTKWDSSSRRASGGRWKHSFRAPIFRSPIFISPFWGGDLVA